MSLLLLFNGAPQSSTVVAGGAVSRPRKALAPYTPYRPYVVVFPNTVADDEDALALILALL